MTSINRDKMSSMYALTQLAKDHQCFTNKEKNWDFGGTKLIQLLREVESDNHTLKRLLLEIKQTDICKTNSKVIDSKELNHKYICKLSQLIGKFENVAKHLDSISASLNKSDIQGTIQIDFRYQKMAVKYLDEIRAELTGLSEFLAFNKKLISEIKHIDENALVKSDLDLIKFFDKTKESIALFITFHEKYNKTAT